MLYIITALKSEAQAFIDRYKLKRSRLKGYAFYFNENKRVIVSGRGYFNSMCATQTLIDYYDIYDEDIFLNVGICSADESFEIGELIEIDSIEYRDELYKIYDDSNKTITCLDEMTMQSCYKIADMESYGFYEATRHSKAIKSIRIFKVVSNYFELQKVIKDEIKSLVSDAIDSMNRALHNKPL